MTNPMRNAGAARRAVPWQRDAVLAAVAAGWCLLLFLTFRPGLMSWDSVDTYSQGVSGRYGNWHPPLISFLNGLAARSVGSPWPILAAQLVVLAGGMALLARKAPRARAPLAVALLAAFLATPPVWSIAVTLWKDGLMAAAMLAAVVALRSGSRALAFSCLVLAVLFRHNAIFAAAPLAVPLVAGTGRRMARAVAGLAALAALAVAPKLADRALGAKDEWTMGALLVFDEVAVYARDPGMLATSPFAGEFTPRDIPLVYWPRSCQPIFSGVPQAHQMTGASLAPRRAAISAEWVRVLRAHPAVYAEHRVRHFLGLLGADGGPVCYPFHIGILKNRWGFELDESARTYRQLRAVQDSVKDSFLFRGWFWMAALTALALAGWRSSSGRLASWTALSGWAYGAAYLVVGVVCDFRYLHWCVVAFFAALMLWVVGSRPDGRAETTNG